MSNATLQVPTDIINPIVQAEITKRIIEAMGNSGELLSQAIASVLYAKVDGEGKVSGYRDNLSWLDWALGMALRKAAKEAIEEVMTSHKETIKKAFVAELLKKNSPLLRQLAEGMINAASNPEVLKYRINISYDEKSR